MSPLEAVDRGGGREVFPPVRVTVRGGAPRELALGLNRPNPFNPSTAIAFELPEAGRVTLRIYDASGRAVRVLIDAELAPGRHSVRWDGGDDSGRHLGSGVYRCRIEAGGSSAARSLVLVR